MIFDWIVTGLRATSLQVEKFLKQLPMGEER